jgi:PAS domain S-box-containing protein
MKYITGTIPAPLKITVIYVVIASLWLLVSGKLVRLLVNDPATLIYVESMIGWAFIAVTALMLFVLIRRSLTGFECSAEEAHLREAKYREFVESANSIIMRRDIAGRILFFNKFAQDFFGYGEEDILGRSVLGSIVPEMDESGRNLANMIEEIGRHPERYANNENENMRRNGERVWIAWTNKPIRNAQGQIVEVLCIGNDITERRRMEKALKESEEKFSKAFYHAPLLMALSNIDDGTYVEVNDKFLHVSGFSREEALGKTSLQLGCILPNERAKLIEMLKARGCVEGMELTLITKDKRPVQCLYNGEVINTGTQPRLLSIIQDITDRKRAEEERETLEARLRQAQKMEAIGTLAGGIAHDFNNILTGIIGYTEIALLDLTAGRGTVRRNLDQVLSASLRARDLVKQILIFSRMRTDQEYQRVNVGQIIQEALKFLRASLPATIEIRQKVESKTTTVLADPTQIHEVLINLCTNAAHAMEDGGILEVTLTQTYMGPDTTALYPGLNEGCYLRLAVTDTGHGMDPITLEHIFEPYFTTKEVGKGTGFGLAVVHGIVKRHGGAITVNSSPGMGTTFYVYLPMVEDTCALDGDMEGTVPEGTESILFVDDEKVLANLASEMLEQLGYRIRTSTSSVEALSLFRTAPHEFDLIITDYTMPQMTGVDLATEILLIRPDMPIILCTGFSEKVNEAVTRKTGIKELVMKPFSMRSIAKVIRRALDDSHK